MKITSCKMLNAKTDTNAEQFQKMRRLDKVIDRINKVGGSETIILGSQHYIGKDVKNIQASHSEALDFWGSF